MPQYASQLQSNLNLKVRDFTSLQELPRIFVNVTKAIGMFVDIWLGTIKIVLFFLNDINASLVYLTGKDIDPSCLYSPKPSNISITATNDNVSPPTNNSQSSRPAQQTLRSTASGTQQSQLPSTLKSTKSQLDTRKSTKKEPNTKLFNHFSFLQSF